ncbi:MAG TPA: UDP-N-acetylglucosamine 2-epimerase (non-hydrolyzing) [Rhizomicrobium sp.]|nr:UDP-N-acetylglucosamine 2-epimerase (non-hydrolyzing) [Rhizomicrobium sp.]
MKKILIVIGTRPEAIKMAPLLKQLSTCPEFSVIVCSTGQHREMLDQVLELFGIRPTVDLKVMQRDQSLSQLTARVLTSIGRVIKQERPDCVLVHGDTTTTMAASLAAFYAKIPLGHVEAGLRSHDMHAPWPEEFNRKLSDTLADRLYAPTERARDNLLREGTDSFRILVTGNTVVDALLDMVHGPLRDQKIVADLARRFPFVGSDKKTILVTCHRRENYGEGFHAIAKALLTLAARSDVMLVFPIHRNPHVRSAFRALKGRENVRLTEPLDYLEFVYLLSLSHIVLTDSGGIQEEAPSLGKPVLVLRSVTERPEAVSAGTVKLVGTDTDKIVAEASALLDNEASYRDMCRKHNPYGDGHASKRIVASLYEQW